VQIGTVGFLPKNHAHRLRISAGIQPHCVLTSSLSLPHYFLFSRAELTVFHFLPTDMSATQLLNPKAESRVRINYPLSLTPPWPALTFHLAERRSPEGEHRRWRRSPGCPQVKLGSFRHPEDVSVDDHLVTTRNRADKTRLVDGSGGVCNTSLIFSNASDQGF